LPSFNTTVDAKDHYLQKEITVLKKKIQAEQEKFTEEI
jgi:hypothetical protein